MPHEKYFKTLKGMVTGTLGIWAFESSTIFQSGVNNGNEKFGLFLMLPGALPDILAPDIGFTDEAVVQPYIPAAKIFL